MTIDRLDEVQAETHQVLSNVSRGSLLAPTPCSEWNMAGLINHLVGAQGFLLELVCVTHNRDADSDADVASGDFVASFDAMASEVRATLAAPDFGSRTLELPFGTFTGERFIDFACLETIVHAWDVARSTSQPTDLAPASCAHLHSVAMAMMGGSPREASAMFAAEQPASAEATQADRLAAYLGRSIH